MTNLVRAADIAARQAWLWRNRSRFGIAARERRVLVDVSAIMRNDAQTGIQRVVRAVWSELLRRNGDGFVVRPVFATSRKGYCYAPDDFLDSRAEDSGNEPVALGPGDKFLGLDLSAHLLPKYRQQLRAWRSHGGTVSVVVYDLLPLQRPEWFTDAATKHFRNWFEVLTSDVDEAICISDEVALSLARRLNGNPLPRIGRLQMGADISASLPSRGLSDEVRATLGEMEVSPSILMVGTIEPRKGYETALAAFEYLWETTARAPNLVIVGKSGWKTSALQQRIASHPELGKRLRWLSRVSDEGLGLLYEAARGILVASLGEGFGLPLIEAAAHRLHVLARDLPVFREQRLSNVQYFQDDSPQELGRRLVEFVEVAAVPPRIDHLPTWRDSVERLLVDLSIGPARGAAARSRCHA